LGKCMDLGKGERGCPPAAGWGTHWVRRKKKLVPDENRREDLESTFSVGKLSRCTNPPKERLSHRWGERGGLRALERGRSGKDTATPEKRGEKSFGNEAAWSHADGRGGGLGNNRSREGKKKDLNL